MVIKEGLVASRIQAFNGLAPQPLRVAKVQPTPNKSVNFEPISTPVIQRTKSDLQQIKQRRPTGYNFNPQWRPDPIKSSPDRSNSFVRRDSSGLPYSPPQSPIIVSPAPQRSASASFVPKPNHETLRQCTTTSGFGRRATRQFANPAARRSRPWEHSSEIKLRRDSRPLVQRDCCHIEPLATIPIPMGQKAAELVETRVGSPPILFTKNGHRLEVVPGLCADCEARWADRAMYKSGDVEMSTVSPARRESANTAETDTSLFSTAAVLGSDPRDRRLSDPTPKVNRPPLLRTGVFRSPARSPLDPITELQEYKILRTSDQKPKAGHARRFITRHEWDALYDRIRPRHSESESPSPPSSSTHSTIIIDGHESFTKRSRRAHAAKRYVIVRQSSSTSDDGSAFAEPRCRKAFKRKQTCEMDGHGHNFARRNGHWSSATSCRRGHGDSRDALVLIDQILTEHTRALNEIIDNLREAVPRLSRGRRPPADLDDTHSRRNRSTEIRKTRSEESVEFVQDRAAELLKKPSKRFPIESSDTSHSAKKRIPVVSGRGTFLDDTSALHRNQTHSVPGLSQLINRTATGMGLDLPSMKRDFRGHSVPPSNRRPEIRVDHADVIAPRYMSVPPPEDVGKVTTSSPRSWDKDRTACFDFGNHDPSLSSSTSSEAMLAAVPDQTLLNAIDQEPFTNFSEVFARDVRPPSLGSSARRVQMPGMFPASSNGSYAALPHQYLPLLPPAVLQELSQVPQPCQPPMPNTNPMQFGSPPSYFPSVTVPLETEVIPPSAANLWHNDTVAQREALSRDVLSPLSSGILSPPVHFVSKLPRIPNERGRPAYRDPMSPGSSSSRLTSPQRLSAMLSPRRALEAKHSGDDASR